MSILNEQQRAALYAQHKLERDRRICDRIKAVLLFDKGWSFEQIAEVLLLSEGAIRHHIQEYQTENKLTPDGGGSNEKLSERQSKLLEEHLQSHTYLYVKDIIAYVYHEWQISYTVPGMRSWLKRHQFSYRKPSVVPGKANEEQQSKWLAEYEKLKAGLTEKETICFMDGTHPTHNAQPAYGWMKKGQPQMLSTNSGRARINLSGAIDILSHRIFVREEGSLNANTTIAFLKYLEEAYPTMSKVHVFCDNASYYHNKEVKAYLENSKVKIHFLPPYSPNLNPIERLWKWMKEVVVYNTYYEEFDAFREAIFGFFNLLENLSPDSSLGLRLRMRVRDRFRPISQAC